MKRLPHSQIIKKREYVVLKRTEDAALVKVVNVSTQNVYGYEVHKIAKNEAFVIHGNKVPAQETLQPDSQFGKKAWYYGPAHDTNAYTMALTKYKTL